MKLNDRCHVIKGGEAHNAWFVGTDPEREGCVLLELDDNCFTEVSVPQDMVRRLWLKAALVKALVCADAS